jgi:hypothetical protein
VRADSGDGIHEFLTWLAARSRRLQHSVGLTITPGMQDPIARIPAEAWSPAYYSDSDVRDGA